MLQKLLPAQALVAPAQSAGPDHDKALLQLDAMLGGLIATKERNDVERTAERGWREEMAAVVAAGGDVEAVKAAAPIAYALVEPAPDRAVSVDTARPAPAPAPPQRVESDVERMNRINSVPANPPPGPRKVWRDHIDAGGNIIAPYFIPHG
jgi:hypothetical protein